MAAAKKIQRPIFDNPFLNIIETPDGSVKRDPEPLSPANADPDGTSLVLSKDVPLDPSKKTWLRFYIPRQATKLASPPPQLPLIVYFHGGGFVFCHADSTLYDDFCRGLVEDVGSAVVSVEYRLAPEHRLPAAYEDAMDSLRWLIAAQDDWLIRYVDLNNCYLCGTSAGGNLAYFAGLRAAAAEAELKPLTIKGMILHHPYFGGSKRTASEEKLANDSLLPLYAIDQMFDLCLPKGADHDHEYCNPLMNGGSPAIDMMKEQGWRVLVTGCFEDPLVDAGRNFAEMLEEKGLRIAKLFGDGYHAMEVFDHSMSGPLYAAIKDFLAFKN